jgi:hypothetical protein
MGNEGDIRQVNETMELLECRDENDLLDKLLDMADRLLDYEFCIFGPKDVDFFGFIRYE